MVQRVDFYLLENGPPHDRFRLACRVTSRAWQAGHRIFISTPDAKAAAAVDELLWSFDQGSFIPHSLLNDCEKIIDKTPIVISDQAPPPRYSDVLISLLDQEPGFKDQFQRLAEVVGGEEQSQVLARERYRAYRTQGLDLHHHSLPKV